MTRPNGHGRWHLSQGLAGNIETGQCSLDLEKGLNLTFGFTFFPAKLIWHCGNKSLKEQHLSCKDVMLREISSIKLQCTITPQIWFANHRSEIFQGLPVLILIFREKRTRKKKIQCCCHAGKIGGDSSSKLLIIIEAFQR